jgi:hypothetical protein
VLIVLHPENQPFQVVDQTRIVLEPDDMDITATLASIRGEGQTSCISRRRGL